MSLDERLRTQVARLAEDNPGWVCTPGDARRDGRVVLVCRRAMTPQPADVSDEADTEELEFEGADWDAAIAAAERGLSPGDQGEPDGFL